MFLFVDTFDFYPNGYKTQLNDNVLTINETNLFGFTKEQYTFSITDENVKTLWKMQYKISEIRTVWMNNIILFSLLFTFPIAGLVGSWNHYLERFKHLIRPRFIRVYILVFLFILAINIVVYPEHLYEMEQLIRLVS